MNILFLTQVLPYPIDAGPKVRVYYNLRYLAKKHSVTLLSFIRESDTSEAINHLKSICHRVETVPMPRSRIRDSWAMLISIITGQPFLMTRDEIPQMDRTIRKMMQEERYDAIHADQLWMAPYALKGRNQAIKFGYHPRINLDQHNAVHLIPKRMAATSNNRFLRNWLEREAKLMAQYEIKTCQKFDHVVWVTREDFTAVTSLQHLSDKEGRQPADNRLLQDYSIIPICIDADGISPIHKKPGLKTMLFVGGMHWPPNSDAVSWFGKEVYPLIKAKCPDAGFTAVGKQPPEALATMGNQVFASGYVKNLDDYWASATVFVVPLRAGGGMRVKILDAWARGIPVVSTTIGAEGITYQPGKDILISDNAEGFAQAVTNILSDEDLSRELSYHGRQTLETFYDWRKIYPAWDDLYQSTPPG